MNLFQSFNRKYIFHPAQALVIFIFFSLFRILPIKISSAIGGWIGNIFGPSLSVSHRATRNLTRVFPEKTSTEIQGIVRGMWNNLGRLAGEYPHLSEINVYDSKGCVEVIGEEIIDQMRDDNRPGVFFSAHIGNWEIVPLCGSQRGLPITRVYRAANNKFVEWLYRQGRAVVDGELIQKGPQGVRPLLSALKDGQHLGILMDQKMNDGISVPFFGFEAMTAPAIVELALRFDCPIIPIHIERLNGCNFRVIIEQPLEINLSGRKNDDVFGVITQINQRIEKWIRARPEQWLWLHNRWSD